MSKNDLAEIEAQELATIEAEMALAAQEMNDELVTTSSRISNSGKSFTLPDGTVMGAKMELVILGYIDASALYPATFDPNSHEPPICYAIGKANSAMIPHPKVDKPEADTCEECPNNEYGSRGNGKACKNEYQVAVVVPGHCETPIVLGISATGRAPFQSSLGAIQKAFGQNGNLAHTCQAVVTAEFTDALYPVVKITGGVPNPDAVAHFRMAKDAVQALLDQ